MTDLSVLHAMMLLEIYDPKLENENVKSCKRLIPTVAYLG